MKRLGAVIAILLGCFCASGQIAVSSCVGNDSLKAYYRDDAINLAIRRMYSVPFGGYRDSIGVPQAYIDTFLNALIAVYNDTAHVASDSVTRLFPAHATCPTGWQAFQTIVVTADTSYPWMRNLISRNIPTGYADLDTFLLGYGFDSVILSSSAGNNSNPALYDVVLHSDSFYNTSALLLQKARIQNTSISFTSSETGCEGNADLIDDSIGTGFIDLIYQHGFDDCQVSCLKFWLWRFRVYPDCRVDYLGDTLYDYSQIGHTGIIDEKVSRLQYIYPNPTTGKVIIEGLQNSEVVTVIDQLGKYYQVIIQGNEINISDLAAGIYYIGINKNQSFLFQKVFKY